MSITNRRAVLISIEDSDKGALIRFDDVVAQESSPNVWKKDVLYTHIPIALEDLDKLEFNDKFLAEFGFNILARLSAFKKTGKF